MSLEVTQRVEAAGLPDFKFQVQTLLNSPPHFPRLLETWELRARALITTGCRYLVGP